MATTEKRQIEKEAKDAHESKDITVHDHNKEHETHSHEHLHEAPKEKEQAEKSQNKQAAKPAAKKETEKKEEPKKKKVREKVALAKVKKSEAVKKLRDKIKEKARLPVFRGKFGCENIRRHNIEKFSKWRKPRGIDTKRKKENGANPRPGYGFCAETKHIHPSGFKEIMVANPKQLQGIQKDIAVRISGTVGQKKRREIVKQANALGVHVLNY